MSAYTGASELAAALKGVDLVIIPAGVPRKPGMTRDDLFNINAGIVRSLIEGVADHCPDVRFFRAFSYVRLALLEESHTLHSLLYLNSARGLLHPDDLLCWM